MSLGLIGALFVSILGLRLIFEGLRGERTAVMISLRLPGWLSLLGGFVCQVPLGLHLWAIWRQAAV